MGTIMKVNYSDHDFHVQAVQDYTQGRSVTAIIATKKENS